MVVLNYVGKKNIEKIEDSICTSGLKKFYKQYRQVLNYFNYTSNIFLLHRQYVFIPYVVDVYYIGSKFLLCQYMFIT